MAPASPTRPNVLFVLTDEQKASTLGLYGDPVLRTPALARLAAEGTLVESAFTPCPLCVPSRGTLLSGRYPRHHGLWFNDQRLAGEVETWFDVLSGDGYRLGLFGKNHCLAEPALERLFDARFEAGHEGFRPEPEDGERAAVNAWLRRPELLRAPWAAEAAPFPAARMPTHVITDRALAFMQATEGPFCVWLSYPDPHTPLQCPEPYAGLVPPAEIAVPPFDEALAASKPERQRVARRMFGSDGVTPEQIRRCLASYYGMQRFIDDELGRVLAYLDRSGRAADTLVVFTSDHGDYMGEHRLVRKSLAFYDALVRVPLVLRLPGRLPAGKRHTEPFSLVDLAPTLLELLGRRPLTGADGRERTAELRGGAGGVGDAGAAPAGGAATAGAAAPACVFGEAGLPGAPPSLEALRDVPSGPLDGRFAPWGSRREAWTGRGWMVRTKDHKLVLYDTGEGELYDLVDDPGELHNRYGDPGLADTQAALASRLHAWRDGQPA